MGITTKMRRCVAICALLSFVLGTTDGMAAPTTSEWKSTKEVSVGDIFADDMLTRLKGGVCRHDIDRLPDRDLRALATQLLFGTYDMRYRVAAYPCNLSYVTLSERWNAPGKFYDQLAGVPGISIPAQSAQTIVVQGIPKKMEVQLRIVAWYVGKVGQHFDGGNPEITTYTLKNGINRIQYDGDWDGLAYICYYADENPERYKDIKVHFVNGTVNGYLSPDKSNEEMLQLCKYAPNYCMDMVGTKVHAVWTSEGLEKYCKSREGGLGYRQYMNIMDSIVGWEHRQLGLEKYGRVPHNRTMSYVNFTYYMFQGGLGVSFHVDQEPRILNCGSLIDRDDDAIWGFSHEWGHQHQMHPYFCWAGMSEVSNNVQSYHNVMMMGYAHPGHIGQWPHARRVFLEDERYREGTTVSQGRVDAYNQRERYRYAPKLYELCEQMKDGVVTAAAQDKLHAVGYVEAGSFEALCPLIMLHNYFVMNGLPDFPKDWYEALRQNDDKRGSQIEKKGKADKYELIASAQNYNKNGKLKELRQRFPQSCWVKEGYITEEHCDCWENSAPFIFNFIRKTSRLTGYNLVPYFERWGYLRQIALLCHDYGDKYYLMTEDMYDEFMADMDALVAAGELKVMPQGMVEEISTSPEWLQPKPEFPN